MKKTIILIVVMILCIVFYFLLQKPKTPIKEAILIKVTEPVKPELPPEPELKPRVSNYYVKPEFVPESLKDFYELKKDERLELVTKMMNNKRLHKEELTFFKAEIFNRKWLDTTRNNMANALVWQTHADPENHKLFLTMLDDDNENAVWRDYCIQFLSECYDSSNDKPLIIEAMKHHSRGSDSKAGTALVHLALQEGFKNIELGPDFSNQIVAQLEDFNTSIHTKTSILAIIGKRGDKSQLPIVRKYAKQDDIAALKAPAIGTLGLIGDVTDMEVILKALKHKNGRVVLAAIAAVNRINERNRAKVKAIKAEK